MTVLLCVLMIFVALGSTTSSCKYFLERNSKIGIRFLLCRIDLQDANQFTELMTKYVEPFRSQLIGTSPLKFNGPFVISLDKDTRRFEGTKLRLSKYVILPV